MKKYLLGSLLLISCAPVCAQDFPNGDFESFKEKTWNGVGAEPEGWFGSNVDQMGFVKVEEVYKDESDKRPESSGNVSVRMMNKFAGLGGAPLGANAPAYITLGSPWVKAAVPASNSDGGTYGGKEFSFKPDAIRGYIKRVLTDQAADANGTPRKDETCNIIFYSWTGHTHSTISGISSSPTKDDIKNNNVIDLDRAILQGVDGVPANTYSTTNDDNFKLVSVGKFDITPDDRYADGEWHLVEIPITYKENDVVPENMNIIISAADYFNRGNIGDGNQLWADDFEFVYDSDLKSLSYDGTPINIADPENIQIAAKDFDLSKVSCTSGKGANIQTSYDEGTRILTISIEGNDISVNSGNHHEYSVKIVPPASEVTGTYNRWITVNMPTPISESANDIEITDEKDGEVSFGLNEFYLGAGSQNMGPIVVPNAKLSYTGDGSINIVAENQMVVVPGLRKDPILISLTANMSEGKKLTADLNILNGFVTVNVGDIPFTTSEENGILKVTGEIATASGAAYVKGGSKANVIDLTGATLAKNLNSSNFSAEANNTLYKIADNQTLDGNNVIQNGTCKNLVLTDGLTFNAPEGFEATNVTFNRKFTTGNLSTVVLPFSFDAADVNGTVYKLESVENGVLSFKSVEGTADANVPYLVKTEGDNLFKKSLTSATVAQTPETVENSIAGTGVTHVGNFGETMTITSDDQTSWYGYNTKGSFVKVLSGTVKPFRSAIKSTGAAPSSFALKLDGTVTGILNLENPNAKVDVYTVSGVCVRKNVPAASALNGLSRGVYIVGGQKVVK